jgi:hypothetical protein
MQSYPYSALLLNMLLLNMLPKLLLMLVLLQVADEWVDMLFPAQKETQLQRLTDMHDTRKAIAVCHNWCVQGHLWAATAATAAAAELRWAAAVAWFSRCTLASAGIIGV